MFVVCVDSHVQEHYKLDNLSQNIHQGNFVTLPMHVLHAMRESKFSQTTWENNKQQFHMHKLPVQGAIVALKTSAEEWTCLDEQTPMFRMSVDVKTQEHSNQNWSSLQQDYAYQTAPPVTTSSLPLPKPKSVPKKPRKSKLNAREK